MPHTVSAVVPWHLLRRLQLEGVVAPSHALSTEQPPAFEQRLPLAQVVDLFADAATRAGVGIAVRAARIPWQDHHSLVQLSARTRTTVGEGWLALAQTWAATSSKGCWEIQRGAGSWTATLDYAPRSAGERRLVEFYLADVVHSALLATHGQFRLERLEVTHADGDLEAFEGRAQPASVRNALVITSATAALPLRGSDPAISRAFERLAHGVAQQAPALGLVEQLSAWLAGELTRGTPSLAEAARHFGTSSRSLDRRLAAEGTRFQRVLDEVRFDLARQWLPDAPVGEVASRLGFAGPRGFHRAFRRWSGQSPSAWLAATGSRTSR
ncbi:MAG: AraC family transcriptional regulator [Myxococcales bacterium]|nr:AraC family transcriptional regulator [Myxococcales bacterium]